MQLPREWTASELTIHQRLGLFNLFKIVEQKGSIMHVFIHLLNLDAFQSESDFYCTFHIFYIKRRKFAQRKGTLMHSGDIISIVKARRESLHVTQETLAQLSGVALRTLKQFESGKGNPTLQTLQKLGHALGLEVTVIIKNTGTNS